ncbi:DUF2490 domain-containing protein [Flavobacterium sediminilitoris]|uniref:DUF2490 domain-containing protein n=1 Tax=Flavobacterium sediminilitoris TaxID=2024526 RepID=A0ABY4HSN0_9FLAO|nr:MULTISPECIES: DUF2490 domain-containing protein [Flavobacterium]UOX35586.1 DUF2490 domain-containing protein [Flavobacterium sediminilitoris]
MGKVNKITILTILFCSSLVTSAQEIIHHDDVNTWFTILNRLSLNSKWSVSNELHERTGAFLDEHGTFLWRPSVDYHLNKNIEFSVGYSYINNKPNDPNPSPKIGAIENNMWEQVLLKHDIGKVFFQHRLRQEHRWFDKVGVDAERSYYKTGTDYANRFRYRITISTPIKTFENGKELFFNGFDELWLPQTDGLALKSLSRNWLYLGFGYKFNSKTNLQIGYMNQWDAIGNNIYISTPILQTTFVRNFDL